MDVLVGIVVGTVLGLTGAGGSVFAVPLLIYVLKLSPQTAMGISLGIVGISACFGVFTKLKSKQINWVPGMIFAIIGSTTAPLGIYLNKQFNEKLLLTGFAFIVMIVAFRMFKRSSRQSNASNANKITEISKKTILIAIPMAALTGILSGLFGVGGGFLIIPSLVIIMRFHIQSAIATSFLIISIVSMSGFISFINSHNDFTHYHLFLKLVGGGMLGMLVGNKIGKHLPGAILEKLFAILMLVMAVFVFGKTILN